MPQHTTLFIILKAMEFSLFPTWFFVASRLTLLNGCHSLTSSYLCTVEYHMFHSLEIFFSLLSLVLTACSRYLSIFGAISSRPTGLPKFNFAMATSISSSLKVNSTDCRSGLFSVVQLLHVPSLLANNLHVFSFTLPFCFHYCAYFCLLFYHLLRYFFFFAFKGLILHGYVLVSACLVSVSLFHWCILPLFCSLSSFSLFPLCH